MSNVTLEPLPARTGDRGKRLTSYIVEVDGEPFGTVFQVIDGWSAEHGRIRIRDYFPVRWGATSRTDMNVALISKRDSEVYLHDRRAWAIERLLEMYR